MAYTTKGKVQNYIAVDIDSSLVSQVDDWITAVTDWINKYCKKVFEAVTETRFYDVPKVTRSLIIDPFVDTTITELSTLDLDGVVENTLTEGDGNDFIAYPQNDTEKYELRLTNGSIIGVFPSGSRRLKVSADFGASASVPKDIELIATKLVGEILRRGLDGGKLSKAKIGDIDLTYVNINETAEALTGIYNTLDQYRHLSI